MRAQWKAVLVFALAAALAACNPFGLPSTRALETGAANMLTTASSFQIAGRYQAAGADWTVVLQVARPDAQRLVVSSGGQTVEAIVVGPNAFLRGQQFLASHVTDARSQAVVKAAGNAWWRGIAVSLPNLPDLTGGAAFRSAFLGPAVTKRTDNQSVDGVDAVELSGARADVFIGSAAPYPLLRVRLKDGVTVDGIANADFVFSHVNADFGIAEPTSVIDFSNVSTLPPIYTVQTVDTSRCGSPCVISATLKNLGGPTGAIAPSTVTFSMTDPVSGKTLGTCAATVQPDVGFNATTAVSCTITATPVNAAVVTAVATNPGHG
ncbi:MAG: hypothetical protein AUI15_34070 [Actinobacteria bacterium 13_2_20CM_2_66_6]|nr:MAG: hypothetical protein AUI15_34070 [Actinobacteria bacterium 13_2_20CM_2_66_6]